MQISQMFKRKALRVFHRVLPPRSRPPKLW